MEYFPLKAGTSQGKLELTSTELGLYLYDVELKAVPSAPEKALNFQTCLGSSQTLTAKFLNYAKHKTDYTCKVWCLGSNFTICCRLHTYHVMPLRNYSPSLHLSTGVYVTTFNACRSHVLVFTKCATDDDLHQTKRVGLDEVLETICILSLYFITCLACFCILWSALGSRNILFCQNWQLDSDVHSILLFSYAWNLLITDTCCYTEVQFQPVYCWSSNLWAVWDGLSCWQCCCCTAWSQRLSRRQDSFCSCGSRFSYWRHCWRHVWAVVNRRHSSFSAAQLVCRRRLHVSTVWSLPAS